MPRSPVAFAVAVVVSVTPAAPAAGPADPADGAAFFEARVRPVLVEHCLGCHGPDKQKGGLRLDSRAAVRKGGDSGPAVVPGNPDDSRIVTAVRRTDPDTAMPPRGKLADAQVDALAEWVARGAPDPRDGSAGPAPPPAAADSHWAFRPIRDFPVPAVRNAAWPRSAVDAFLLAKLEAAGLAPSPPADKRTLLRRAAIDLTGLPPTWDEVRAFEADPAPDAFDNVVDRLLASPRYGERWARHWLDVARYADTKDGVLMFGDDRLRPFAYTYRDYVVRAFNGDMPFDRFVRDQLAADLQGPAAEPWRLAALGFLTLGRMFDNNAHDIIDDRIDTVTRGLLGLTVSCARCHDHKYDPIPTADYYSLYGVFASCEAPLVPPPLDPAAKGTAAFEAAYAAKVRDVQQMLDRQYALLSDAARGRAGDYLVHIAATKPDPLETAVFFRSLGPNDLRPRVVAKWRAYVAARATAGDPVFGPWHDLFALPDDRFASDAPAVVARWRETAGADPLVAAALAAKSLAAKADVARAYAAALKTVYDEYKTLIGPPDPARRGLLDVLTAKDGPASFPKSATRLYMSRAEVDRFGKLLTDLDKLAAKAPDAPPRAMALADAPDLCDPKVFVRGNPARPGEAVPRRFLAVLSGGRRDPFPRGSGRLDLADAIVARDNPLTARVIANRVWMHHFGEPLVETPNDFGLRTPAPVQAELLDHLAAFLRDNGWSLKKLHRHVVLSAAYRQAGSDRPDGRAADPDNRLIWRMNRKRLEFEAMRDGLLAAAGRLDERLYGRPGDAAGDPGNRRRTVYGLVDRQSLPGVFRAFDFAGPDQSAERRPRTTVPQQALFGMNSPFVLEQAKAVAALPEMAAEADPAGRVRALYRAVLAREPDADEVRIGTDFVAAAGGSPDKSPVGPWPQFAQVLLLTNEMMFVD